MPHRKGQKIWFYSYVDYQATNKQNETYRYRKLVITRREGTWEEVKWVKVVECMVTNGKYNLGGEHTIVYT